MSGFVHLHVHTEYSLLDGSSKLGGLCARAKELGMEALAITDHGAMYGVIDFYKKAKEAGIKPIIGCEVYVASGSRLNKESGADNFYYHLVLLAENNEGYKNLVKLVSAGFTEGFYYRPRVDLGLLREYSAGLIALSACIAGPVARTILDVSYEKAKEIALTYSEIFGPGNFFLEMQDHGMAKQKTVNKYLVQMSRETGLPLVCTNDSHYTFAEDAAAHDVLLCIQTNKKVDDEDRMRYEGGQMYLKSPEEMAALFPAQPEALANTAEIARRCNVEFKFNEYKLPKFKLPPGEAEAPAYLEKLCAGGLARRYGEITAELRARLDYEIDTIKSMGFTDYFLIVADFIRFARDAGISVGPGRGSGTGSLAAFCLGITNIDPIKYGLIFERFLNPERISMPDFDIDFCYVRRQEVINYVIETYGADHVAQIITFGTMAARGVIRDVGRALGIAYGEVDKIAKMIPFAIGMTIARALEISSELRELYENNEKYGELIDMAQRLEGLPRHSSTHAAGVVICSEPVTEFVPLSVNQRDNSVTTQFPMNTLEELGLLKMDFLGLRTLTVIQSAVSEINKSRERDGEPLDIDKIDLTDKYVWEMISQARTEGVFQLESAGMKSFMRELQPGRLEDLIAGISLYRPGPMDFIPKYIKGKKNAANVKYDHPLLKPILEPTYGCIVYQEQVMRIVRDLAGYSMGRSDLVRRAMSKKKADVMEKERRNFIYGLGDEIPGCIKNGVPEAVAAKLFDEMGDFARYAFNKSHAAAYAMVGYQTAWLKYHYKTEFMAAMLTSVMDFSGKVAEYINECRKIGIEVLPPDINESFGHFSVAGKKIRFGLTAVKNVGRPAIAAIVAAREGGGFKSLTEFIERTPGADINKRAVESLIKAGAFDSLGGTRLQYISVYENIMNAAGSSRKRNISGQMSLFDAFEEEAGAFRLSDDLPETGEYSPRERLAYEKEVLGLFLSGHPLLEYEPYFRGKVNISSLDLALSEDPEAAGEDGAIFDGKPVVFGGMVARRSVKYTKNNEAMAFLTLEDSFGEAEVIVFPKTFEKFGSRLIDGAVVLINGRVSVREDEAATIVCNELKIVGKEDLGKEARREIWIKIPRASGKGFEDIKDILLAHPGNDEMVVYIEKTRARIGGRANAASPGFKDEITGALGEGCFVVR